jgi:hypothetical protein
MTLTTFGTLRGGIDGQVSQFGERLDLNPEGRERVEYAIKFPAEASRSCRPSTPSFPRKTNDHLQEAVAAGDSRLLS